MASLRTKRSGCKQWLTNHAVRELQQEVLADRPPSFELAEKLDPFTEPDRALTLLVNHRKQGCNWPQVFDELNHRTLQGVYYTLIIDGSGELLVSFLDQTRLNLKQGPAPLPEDHGLDEVTSLRKAWSTKATSYIEEGVRLALQAQSPSALEKLLDHCPSTMLAGCPDQINEQFKAIREELAPSTVAKLKESLPDGVRNGNTKQPSLSNQEGREDFEPPELQPPTIQEMVTQPSPFKSLRTQIDKLNKKRLKEQQRALNSWRQYFGLPPFEGPEEIGLLTIETVNAHTIMVHPPGSDERLYILAGKQDYKANLREGEGFTIKGDKKFGFFYNLASLFEDQDRTPIKNTELTETIKAAIRYDYRLIMAALCLIDRS